MAPVERTKWMTSAWDRTLDHACVHCVSRSTMDCSGDCLHCGATLDTFSQAFATSHPTPLATLAQNWCAPSKKRSEMASNQVSNKYQATL